MYSHQERALVFMIFVHIIQLCYTFEKRTFLWVLLGNSVINLRAADSITLWIMFNGAVCRWKLWHLKLLTLWYVSFREASGIISGHVSMWLVQVASLSHTSSSVFCESVVWSIKIFSHEGLPIFCLHVLHCIFFQVYIIHYWANITAIALGRCVRNGRK